MPTVRWGSDCCGYNTLAPWAQRFSHAMHALTRFSTKALVLRRMGIRQSLAMVSEKDAMVRTLMEAMHDYCGLKCGAVYDDINKRAAASSLIRSRARRKACCQMRQSEGCSLGARSRPVHGVNAMPGFLPRRPKDRSVLEVSKMTSCAGQKKQFPTASFERIVRQERQALQSLHQACVTRKATRRALSHSRQ